MREILLLVVAVIIAISTYYIGVKIDILTTTIKQKQIILNISELYWDVSAAGGVVNLSSNGKEDIK